MRRSLAAALLLSGLATAFVACAPESDTTADDPANRDDALRACATGTTLKGVDVSEYQGKVDWAKVKAAGRSFGFARVSDGLHSPDSQFAANWAGMKAQGLVRGAYQYFRASQDAVTQADLLVAHIGTLGPGDLPPVIDVETTDGVSTAKVTAGVRAWIDRVKAKTGVTPIIYTGSGFWDSLPNTAQFSASTLWVANYTTQCASMPTTWKQWSFWQFSDSGSVSGISGKVDVDQFNGTLAQLEALTVSAPTPPSGCTTDDDCNGGQTGKGLVCSNSGATAGDCISGCHADSDCASGHVCDETKTPWQCEAPVAPPPPVTDCPVLTFPSGIKIQTVKDATMTASYKNHLAAGQTAPLCFLDVTHLLNPDTGETYNLTVHVAANFQLSELVGTEVSQGWGDFVLLSPAAVASLQKFRVSVGQAVSVNSGFRGPKHQESVCNSLCGNPLGCSGTCANNSRHMWGDAFDLPTTFYNHADTNLACSDRFKFTYLESGTHLHVDQNPAYATCVQQ